MSLTNPPDTRINKEKNMGMISTNEESNPMGALGFFSAFNRRTIFAAAMSIMAVFAFFSSASASENRFDALRGVTAEALSPAAMDAVRGTGSVHIGFWRDKKWNHWDWVAIRYTGGPWNVWIRLEQTKGGQLILTKD